MMPDLFLGNGTILTVAGKYKAGDMPPSGYLDHEEWWHVQKKAGLKQVQCKCGKWCFPQQLTEHTITFEGKDAKGNVVLVTTPICKECFTATPLANHSHIDTESE